MIRNCARLGLEAVLILGLLAPTVQATLPYMPVILPPNAQPGVGPGVIPAPLVFGKEYSHDYDTTTVGAIGPPPPADPEQVIAWDGMGGATDGLDYSLSRPVDFPREQEVDALANSHDALYQRLRQDRAHLIFSHDDRIAVHPGAGGVPFFPAPGAIVPPTGPVALSNGDVIGGSGDLSVEESGVYSGFEIQHLWTPAPTINAMPPTTDVDSVEVWGPEPGITADSDNYSLEDDVAQFPAPAGIPISVFHYILPGGPSVPYITHPTIVAAVESVLGTAPTTAFNQYERFGRNAINLDALMVQDNDGVDEQFGPGDSIIFSISQMVDQGDADGYYATGSELFHMELTAAGILATSYLSHGGHSWSHAYTLAAMGIAGLPGNDRAYIDINAIEAIGNLVVPEPSSLALVACALVGMARRRKR